MLSKANEAGHIQGVVPHLIPGGITHLQYADDTMVMIEPTDEGIANLKLILLCFENMSGLNQFRQERGHRNRGYGSGEA
jgi:hypothetical protein